MLDMLPVQNIVANHAFIIVKFDSKFGIDMVCRFFPIKRRFANRLNAVWDIDFNKTISAGKSILSDRDNLIRKSQFGIRSVIVECIISYRLQCGRERDIRQFAVQSKSIISDFCDSVLHNDGIHIGVEQHIIGDLSRIAPHSYRQIRRVSGESICTDIGNAIRHRYRLQFRTFMKRLFSERFQCIRQFDCR